MCHFQQKLSVSIGQNINNGLFTLTEALTAQWNEGVFDNSGTCGIRVLKIKPREKVMKIVLFSIVAGKMPLFNDKLMSLERKIKWEPLSRSVRPFVSNHYPKHSFKELTSLFSYKRIPFHFKQLKRYRCTEILFK